MSNSAAPQMNHAKRLSHLVDFPTEEEYDEWDGWDKCERTPSEIYPPGVGDAAGLFCGCAVPGDGEGDEAPCAPPASSARSFSQAS
jgi:hypothetical protein